MLSAVTGRGIVGLWRSCSLDRRPKPSVTINQGPGHLWPRTLGDNGDRNFLAGGGGGVTRSFQVGKPGSSGDPKSVDSGSHLTKSFLFAPGACFDGYAVTLAWGFKTRRHSEGLTVLEQFGA